MVMPEATTRTRSGQALSFERHGEIAEIQLNTKPLSMAADIEAKDALMDRLNEVAADQGIKVLIIRNYTAKTGVEEYIEFHKRLLDPARDKFLLEKMLNSFDELILKLAGMSQIVVHVDCGRVLTQFLSVGLACDYRLVADDTWYQKGYFALNLIPKGGLAFFLTRLLGRAKAVEILLSEAEIPAENALHLGLVNRVAPLAELMPAARRVAEEFASKPGFFLASMKRLLSYDLAALKEHLAMENREILRIRGLPEFMESLKGV
jgi:2-(1,2-epoxy-1,2-dihydrophenyl)acetyl-CoA isomerase